MSQDSRFQIQEKMQKGQMVLILLLVMTVALAIGLSIVQRSLTDISTSTKIEQSSRAFSAAEAGIERALQQNRSDGTTLDIGENIFENNTTATVTDSGLLPNLTNAGQALEYPPVSKEEIVHVWLSDPNELDFPNTFGKYYDQQQLDIYWGTVETRKPEEEPALEVTIVSFNETSKTYSSKKFLLDPLIERENNFLNPGASFQCSHSVGTLGTIFGNDRAFYCKASLAVLPQTLVLLRARILYSNSSHPVAVQPYSPPGQPCTSKATDDEKKACSLPPQVKIIKSSGNSGEAQRTVQLFTVEKVVPFYLDYALFSAGDIKK